MISRFFKTYQPSVLITIILLGIVLFIRAFIINDDLDHEFLNSSMPLFLGLKLLIGHSLTGYLFISLFLFIIEANYLVRLNLKYFFIEERTYLPAFFYLTLASVFFLITGFHVAQVGVLFFLFILDLVISTGNGNAPNSKFFDIGLLLAAGSLFYINLLLFFVLILISLLVLKSFSIRRMIIIIAGILVVYFIVWFFYFFTGHTHDFYTTIEQNFLTGKIFFQSHWTSYMFFGWLCFLMVWALLSILLRFNQKKIIARKYFNVINSLLVFTALCMAFLEGSSNAMIYFLLIPGAYILSDFFVHLKYRIVREIAFGVYIAVLLITIILLPV